MLSGDRLGSAGTTGCSARETFRMPPLVKGVADARFFSLLHIQEIICLLRLGVGQKVVL